MGDIRLREYDGGDANMTVVLGDCGLRRNDGRRGRNDGGFANMTWVMGRNHGGGEPSMTQLQIHKLTISSIISIQTLMRTLSNALTFF